MEKNEEREREREKKNKDKIEWIRNDKKGQNKHLKMRTHAKITTATATIVTRATTKFDDHQEKKEIVKCLPSYLIKITLFKWLVKHIAC